MITILCIASFEKGFEFLREAKRQGALVILLTSESLKDSPNWPRESIDEIYFMPDVDKKWNRTDTLHAVAYLARSRPIDVLVPLDDFDLEMAAFLREHLRIAGMGETTTRYFRDKLAMRMQAAEHGIAVPEFSATFPHARLGDYTERIAPPWVLKPRFMAGAIGIKKCGTHAELWEWVHALGDQQSYYLVERYVPGEIFHVDSIVSERQVVFAIASAYGQPPLDVAHSGGIFTTRTVDRQERALVDLNARVLAAFNLVRGVSHTEFIRGHDGKLYFLETSARVGGAHIADMVEAASGLNLWAEWAKIEIGGGKSAYALPTVREDHAGLLVSLAKPREPDTTSFDDPEIVWRMRKDHHVGLIVRSPERGRVEELLAGYTGRVQRDFHAAMPPKETASE